MAHKYIIEFSCAYCGVMNEVECDPNGARRVDLYEDCQVCCRPNLVHITVDDETKELSAEAEEA